MAARGLGKGIDSLIPPIQISSPSNIAILYD